MILLALPLFTFSTLKWIKKFLNVIIQTFGFLKSFLDPKDSLLNNLETLEHLRSLSVTIKTGKDEILRTARP